MRSHLWLACLFISVCLAPVSAQERKPNIIVILADDTGYADLGCHGGKDVPTPNIDSIAKNGVRCTNGYVSCPYCSPTRAGLLTGRYQQRFGHEFNEGQGKMTFGLPLTETTFAQRMKDLGYVTAAVGKWHLGNQPEYRPMKRGFDEFYGTLGNSPFRKPMLVDSRIDANPKLVEDDAFYTTDAYSDRAVDIIEKYKDKQFFLYLPFNANHVPVQPPPQKYIDRVKNIENMNRRLYAAMFCAMDDAVGRVLTKLRDLKLEENTLIFFLADNGGPMTKMGPNGSENKPLKGQKGDTWEGAIRVPFLVQWKGKLSAGKVYDSPVISLDILPTALVAAGGKVSADWKLDGVDLLPFLTEKAKGVPHESLYWRFGTQWAIRQGDWKLVQGYDYDAEQPTGQPQLLKVVAPRLHNLAEDIGETKDLAAQHPDKVKVLKAVWDAWNKELQEPGWLPQPPKKKK